MNLANELVKIANEYQKNGAKAQLTEEEAQQMYNAAVAEGIMSYYEDFQNATGIKPVFDEKSAVKGMLEYIGHDDIEWDDYISLMNIIDLTGYKPPKEVVLQTYLKLIKTGHFYWSCFLKDITGIQLSDEAVQLVKSLSSKGFFLNSKEFMEKLMNKDETK